MTTHLLDAVKLSEGFRDRVYKCTEGYDTIGYGFAVKDLVMDEDIAEMILRRKLDALIDRVNKRFPFVEEMPEAGQDVIYEMCYQLGVSGVSKFKKTLAYLENREYRMAASEMLDSKWHRQTPNRSQRLSDIIREL
jgi:lysozyme